MATLRPLAVLLFASLLPATLPAAPTAVEYQGILIGSKLRTTPVKFDRKAGLPGGGVLAPGLYDVEVASTGDKTRVMLLFFQNGRKMGEAPGLLKLGPGGIVNPCGKAGGVVPCNGMPKSGVAQSCITFKGQQKGGQTCPEKSCISFKSDQPGARTCVAKGCISFKSDQPGARTCVAKGCITFKGGQQATSKRYLTFEQLGFAGGVKPSLRAGAGGGILLTIPGAGGASVEAQLPAAH